MSLSRRNFLASIPLIGASAATPALASDLGQWTADPESPMTAEQRRDYHLAEYQRACEELDPDIDRWSIVDRGQIVMVTAHRVSGRYSGDGYYDVRTGNGFWAVDYVQLSPDRIDGERTFLLTRWPGVGKHYCRVTESRLKEIIGAPHSGRFGAAT